MKEVMSKYQSKDDSVLITTRQGQIQVGFFDLEAICSKARVEHCKEIRRRIGC